MPDRDELHAIVDSENWANFSLVNRGRTPNTWASALSADPMLSSAAVIVDLSLGRGQRRIVLGPASPAIVAGGDGRARGISQAMATEPELSESIDVGETGPSNRSVAVSLDGRFVNAADLLATGWPIAGRAEISLVADGVGWEDRLVWVRGPTAGGVSFGTDDEFVDLTVDDPPLGGSEIPPWILDSERWPDIVDQSVGQRVPLVLGRGSVPCPRVDHSTGIDTDGDGSNDIPAGTRDEFVVCYGHSVNVQQVWVDKVPKQLTTHYTVNQGVDALGLPVTTIRGVVAAFNDTSKEVHARVIATNTVGLDLATLIRKILHDYGGFTGDRLSDRLFADFQARLGLYGADATTGLSIPRVVINDPSGSLDYVTSGLLESFPYVSLVWDGAGIGPVVVDHRAEPVASLTNRAGYVLGRPEGGRYQETALTDLRTGFSLQYDYDAVQQSYAKVATRNRKTNALCDLAAQVIGADQVDGQRTSVIIADSASAEATLDWLCEHRCRPAYDVEIECLPVAWFQLRLGDTVEWTDDDEGFSAERAIVIGRSWVRGLVTITLRVFPRLWRVAGGSIGWLG
jgi:hypothetical protein